MSPTQQETPSQPAESLPEERPVSQRAKLRLGCLQWGGMDPVGTRWRSPKQLRLSSPCKRHAGMAQQVPALKQQDCRTKRPVGGPLMRHSLVADLHCSTRELPQPLRTGAAITMFRPSEIRELAQSRHPVLGVVLPQNGETLQQDSRWSIGTRVSESLRRDLPRELRHRIQLRVLRARTGQEN